MDILKLPDLTQGSLMFTFALGFITLALMLWHSHRKQSYWRNIGIPYAKAYPIVGSVLENMSKPMHMVELDRIRKYGRIYGHYEGNTALLSVADPDLLRNILVKDFHVFSGSRHFVKTGDMVIENMLSFLRGDDWKRVRSIVTPTFTTGKIRRMMGIFKDCSQTLAQNFRAAAENEKPIEVKSIYGSFTMDVIANSAFSTKIDSHNDPNNEFVKHAKKIFGSSFYWRFVLFLVMPIIVKLFRIHLFPKKNIDFFANLTLQIIEERSKTGKKRNDFLQLLLDTTNEDSKGGDSNEKDDILENYGMDENSAVFTPAVHSKKTLSHYEMIAQCVNFFLAGYEMTSMVLAYVSYVLALHPDMQEKLIQEVDDALTKNNGELTYEAIQSMKYLDNVISETMRLYSPAIRSERLADEDYKLGDTGLTIPKGTVVTIPIYAIHRDPEIFPDPEKFDPDRFTPDERAKRSPYGYLPFGAGPRNCVGMRFVLVEIKVGLAHMLSKFRFKRCPKTKVPLELHMSQGILQAKDVTLELEIRKGTVKTS